MKRFRRFITGLVTVIVVGFSCISAFADSLNDEEFTRRIDFIQNRLDEGKLNATRWQYYWMYLNGGIAFAQLGISIDQTDSDEKNDRYDNIVGGIAGVLAVGDLAFNPLNSWNAAGKLQDFLQATKE